ncbi:MAG: dihydroxy-acid dehydratase [Verrucomicrobia bacterium]|nr:dihydroxy-acid dehydratase [Verrucomicrobiota bacterium]
MYWKRSSILRNRSPARRRSCSVSLKRPSPVQNRRPHESHRGAIALVTNGDSIMIDEEERELTLEVPSVELKKRKKAWKKPAPRYTRGVLAKYAAHVTSASLGAVTDADLKL